MNAASSTEDLDSDFNNIMRLLVSDMTNSERLVVLKSSLRSVYKHEIVNVFKEVGLWDPNSNKFKSKNPDWNRLKTKLEECKAGMWKQSAASAQDFDTESEDEDTRFGFESSYTVILYFRLRCFPAPCRILIVLAECRLRTTTKTKTKTTSA
jgi:hypothetical protein